MNRMKRIRLAAFALTAFAVSACPAMAGDVFSDAASWHRGFVGSGPFENGTSTQFPESLKLGDAGSGDHAVAVAGYTKADANQITLRTETVVYPYANVTRDETVGYFPQKVVQNGNYCAIYSEVLKPNAPFVVSNANEYTYFVRFRWDGPIDRWNTSKVTNTLAEAFIINAGWDWGNKCGMMIGLHKDGYLRYSGGQDNYGNFNITVRTNVWTDCAVVAKNGRLTAYLCQAGGTLTTDTVTLNANSLGTPTTSEIRLGGLQAGSYWNIPQNYGDGGDNLWKVFRGSIHSFASWSRALSADEIRQVFAWPRTDLFRLGTVNGSSLEFAGNTSSATTAGAQNDHALTPATLTAGNPSLTISFNVPAQSAGLAQILRVTGAGSGHLALAVTINGMAAGQIVAVPGKTSLNLIPGELFHAGANTLTLTRTASSGNACFDAIALGGGLQIGNQDDSETSDFSDTDTRFLHYYATDGNWKHVMGRIMAINESHNYRKTRLHVYIPDEVVARSDYSLIFSFSVKVQDGPSGQPFGLYLNGSETPVLTASVQSGAWREFKYKVSADELMAGDNVFVIANDYTCSTYTGLFGFDYFRIEPVCKQPFVLILR